MKGLTGGIRWEWKWNHMKIDEDSLIMWHTGEGKEEEKEKEGWQDKDWGAIC